MKNFEKRLENEGFHVILLPSDKNTTIHPYGFLIEDAILIAMVDEEDDNGIIYLKDGRIYMKPYLKEYDITDHIQTLVDELEKMKR